MPTSALAGVGHTAFRRDVTCVCEYVTFVTRFVPANLVQIHVHVYLAANNSYTFCARKLKLCMTLTYIKTC